MSADEQVDINEMESPEPPVRFEIFPEELFATVNVHDIQQGEDSFSCWSFISEGLSKYGQRELAILVRKQADQSLNEYPTDVLGFFLTVRRYASEQSVFMEGDITEFGEQGFLDEKFKALAYVKPVGLTGNNEQDESLLNCILLTEDELEIARKFGLTRVVSLMGHSYNHYPCPPWIDLDRDSTVNKQLMSDMDNSILAKVPFLNIPYVRVCLCVDKLVISCKKGTHEFIRDFLKQLPLEAPFSIGCDIDPEANAMLVWQKTMQNGPSAITPPGSDGSRVAGCSLIVFPEQEESNAQVIEDSFLLSLKSEDWEKLRNGFMTGNDVKFSAQSGGTIQIGWYEESDSTFMGVERPDTMPELPMVEHADGFGKVLEASLLSDEDKTLETLDARILVQFMEACQMTVLGYFTDRRPEVEKEITLDCTIEPNQKVSWSLSSSPEEDSIELKGIQIRLSDLPVPALISHDIKFKNKFLINKKD